MNGSDELVMLLNPHNVYAIAGLLDLLCIRSEHA